mmetsp:Transcript_2233/g.8098  ORF Transcript_2233/g.8098 Transcript_2233/m.8098 type:complete len:217 (-) Transcript_2233:102-752(-)
MGSFASQERSDGSGRSCVRLSSGMSVEHSHAWGLRSRHHSGPEFGAHDEPLFDESWAAILAKVSARAGDVFVLQSALHDASRDNTLEDYLGTIPRLARAVADAVNSTKDVQIVWRTGSATHLSRMRASDAAKANNRNTMTRARVGVFSRAGAEAFARAALEEGLAPVEVLDSWTSSAGAPELNLAGDARHSAPIGEQPWLDSLINIACAQRFSKPL